MKILCLQGSFNFTAKLKVQQFPKDPPPEMHSHRWYIYYQHPPLDGTFTITDKFCELVVRSCPTLRDSMNCSAPGSSVHGIPQARMLEWVAISSSRGSSQPRSWTRSPSLQSDSLPAGPPGNPSYADISLPTGAQFTAFDSLSVLCILWVWTVQSFKNAAQIQSHFAENLPQASHYTGNKDIPTSRPGPLCFWYFLGENTLFSALHKAGSFGSNVRSSQKFL